MSNLTLEVGRIVQLHNQRGDEAARLILADDIVKLRAAKDEAHRKYEAVAKERDELKAEIARSTAGKTADAKKETEAVIARVIAAIREKSEGCIHCAGRRKAAIALAEKKRAEREKRETP